LLDSHGSAIGINTMIYGTQGKHRNRLRHADQFERARDPRRIFEPGEESARPDAGDQRSLRERRTWLKRSSCRRREALLIQGRSLRLDGGKMPVSGARGRNVIVGNYRIGVGGDPDHRHLTASRWEGPRFPAAGHRTNESGPEDTLELTVCIENKRSQKIRVKLGEAPQAL